MEISTESQVRRSKALSDVACRTVKAGPRLKKLSDAGGLQLWVQPNGSKLWRLAYRFGGKQKLLALGTYPQVALAEARSKRDEAKKHLRDGRDPSEVRKQEKIAQAETATTFRDVAEEYLAKKKREDRSPATMTKLEWLLSFAYPALGHRAIKDIRAAHVLPVLREVEERGRRETARRLRGVIGCVFRLAIATERAEMDPTAALQGALAEHKSKPRAAVTDPKAFGALLRAIDGFDGQETTAAALKLMAILFPRPGELRAAEWTEFDLENATWTIPAARTKMRREHRIPLPKQAVAILKALRKITGKGRLVFPSVRTTARSISETTLNAALRRMGYGTDEATSHGFRASAATLLNESGKWHPDAVERQLAHIESNDVRRAYTRGEHWDERVQMMQWWADYLDELRANRNTGPIASAA